MDGLMVHPWMDDWLSGICGLVDALIDQIMAVIKYFNLELIR